MTYTLLVAGCKQLMDKEFWLEVHDASPSSFASNVALHQGRYEKGLRNQNDTPQLQSSWRS
ncbi:hypothetical protein F2Q70_00028029 [Brassica cretica]|uniref:Uncharacterized protein n=1 Tax=Brassica cretica TaxID=69181 RepID=A0A3N6U758_BRACR|nr:hypothetical protein F2Q70_00028029 [Brassica cretica]KAF3579551.1 hypothetical protein DY000_02034653 [Brassica cretica]